LLPRFFILFIAASILNSQEIDSSKVKHPKQAAWWSIFPGGGQIYNGDYLKAGVFITLESLALWQSIDNGIKYTNEESNSIYLQERNKYAWWAFFIHIFGFIDAVVDSHLEPFDAIMGNDSLEIKYDEKEIQIND